MYLNLDLLYNIKFYGHLDYMLFEGDSNYLLINIITKKSLEFTTKSFLMMEHKFIFFKMVFDLTNFRVYGFEETEYSLNEIQIDATYQFLHHDYIISKDPINFEIPKEISEFLNSKHNNLDVLKNVKKINILY